jgi:iron(III) transport system substrate-binding protein
VADLLYADRVRHGGYDTSVLKVVAIVCAVLWAEQAGAANRDLYLYQGADRAQKLVAGAKKEGQVVLYSTMTVQDGRTLGAAFEKKYGIKLVHWRGSAEKIVQRALAEARSGHDGADVFETSSHRMEALYREKLLEDFYTPAFQELSPAAFPRGHRQYVAARFAFFVLGYNTRLVKPAELPATYEDLLHPRWSGRLAIESTDVLWFAALTKAMGEERGLTYFKRLAAMKPTIRNGHILAAQLVASGEIPLLVTAYNNNMETLKKAGAPVDWKPLAPAFGQASAIGLARDSRRPHAALLFTEFLLSRDGQEFFKSVNRVPSSLAVETPLNKFSHEIIDPAIALDEGDKWDRLWSNLFLGGKPVERDE